MDRKLLQLAGIFMIFALLTGCGKKDEKVQTAPKTEVQAEQAPLSSFSQEISVANKISSMKAGETFTLNVTLKNTTNETWDRSAKKHHIHPVCQWKDSSGNVVVSKAAYLPKSLSPNESITLEIPVTAPEKKGKYTLKITMVQEDVAFFEKKGAKPLEIPVTVN